MCSVEGQRKCLFTCSMTNLYMRKLLAILKELLRGGASIESVGKSPISKTPGNVTQIAHN
jgi:hypothetical protein